MLMKKLIVFIATLLMSFPMQGRVMLVSDTREEVLLERDNILYAFWSYYGDITHFNVYGEVEVIPNVYDGQSSWLGSWGRFSDHFFDKKELNDVAIFK